MFDLSLETKLIVYRPSSFHWFDQILQEKWDFLVNTGD